MGTRVSVVLAILWTYWRTQIDVYSILLCGLLLAGVLTGRSIAELATNGIRPSNVLGGLEQHASFSFVRPGLTQTAFAFNGPASHQSFSSSVGDPHLAHRVLPSVAHALAYHNPGLAPARLAGGPVISTGFVGGPPVAATAYHPQQIDYQRFYHQQQQQALALAYQQQFQQYQQQSQIFPGFAGQEYTQQAQVQALHDIGNQESVHQAHLA